LKTEDVVQGADSLTAHAKPTRVIGHLLLHGADLMNVRRVVEALRGLRDSPLNNEPAAMPQQAGSTASATVTDLAIIPAGGVRPTAAARRQATTRRNRILDEDSCVPPAEASPSPPIDSDSVRASQPPGRSTSRGLDGHE